MSEEVLVCPFDGAELKFQNWDYECPKCGHEFEEGDGAVQTQRDPHKTLAELRARVDEELITISKRDGHFVRAAVTKNGKIAGYKDYKKEEIHKALTDYQKLKESARIMHFDLIALGQIPLAEMVDLFGDGKR